MLFTSDQVVQNGEFEELNIRVNEIVSRIPSIEKVVVANYIPGKPKILDKFNNSKSGYLGLRPCCKDCSKDYWAEYYNKESTTLIKKKREIFYLLITGILIFVNWSTWIYAVVSSKIIDASFGYFIMPILSVFFGILFFK